ncbi:MAG: non-canonical purine NTP pyrophosphatase, partial [Candidatus Methanomethylophilaceae archaeon]|nr:non-canonical purine NTP pyrophosphatase [Candidatus Methanomethylophilaceae archaeon]
GTDGFGFDPIFSPDGKLTFAEMSVDEKNLISHRGNAVRLLIEQLKG